MLKICELFFEELNRKGIDYCHWKSNQHLVEGLEGKTDLDILIDRDRYFEINQILFSLRFKRYETKSYLKYVSIEDFIGLDEHTGKLIHIHLHYELRTGKKFIKEYHLSFENYIYNNRVFDSKYKVSIINPNIEIILLLVRHIIKNDGILFKKNNLNGGFRIEFNWLLSKISTEEVYKHSIYLFGEDFAESIIEFIKNNTDIKLYNRLKKDVLIQADKYRTSHKAASNILYLCKKLEAGINVFLHKKCNLPNPYRRVNPNGGRAVVFVGVDGSGKSTLTSAIRKWLTWKVDVFSIYFGSGVGKSSIYRYPLLKLGKLIKRTKTLTKPGILKESNDFKKEKRKSAVYRFCRFIWAISLAHEKKSKFRQLQNAKSKGLYVICDRYPQYQIMNFNDGPLLSEYLLSKNFILRKIANWEFCVYKLSEIYPPDIVIRLNISDEIAFERKPDMSIDVISKKNNAIKKITYGKNTKVYEIDTSEDINVVLLKIKKILWGL